MIAGDAGPLRRDADKADYQITYSAEALACTVSTLAPGKPQAKMASYS